MDSGDREIYQLCAPLTLEMPRCTNSAPVLLLPEPRAPYPLCSIRPQCLFHASLPIQTFV